MLAWKVGSAVTLALTVAGLFLSMRTLHQRWDQDADSQPSSKPGPTPQPVAPAAVEDVAFSKRCPRLATARCSAFVNQGPFLWASSDPPGSVVKHGDVSAANDPFAPIVRLGEEILRDIESNARESYKAVARTFKDASSGAGSVAFHREADVAFFAALEEMGHDVSHSRVAIFCNSWVSRTGWVVDATACKGLKNGGCGVQDGGFNTTSGASEHERVVSIAGAWTASIWHFPMEALVGMAALVQQGEDLSKTVLHVSSKTKYVLSWIQIVLGIPADRVLDGDVFARTLVIPEMGKCGTPTRTQLEWLQRAVVHSIRNEPGTQDRVLLIKRTKKRQMKNFDQVQASVDVFARSHNLTLDVFDDRKLPPLPKQWARFKRAAFVIAPHGAGLVNLVSAPQRTPVIEFMPRGRMELPCLRLAAMCGLPYAMLYYDSPVRELEKVMASMHAAKGIGDLEVV